MTRTTYGAPTQSRARAQRTRGLIAKGAIAAIAGIGLLSALGHIWTVAQLGS